MGSRVPPSPLHVLVISSVLKVLVGRLRHPVLFEERHDVRAVEQVRVQVDRRILVRAVEEQTLPSVEPEQARVGAAAAALRVRVEAKLDIIPVGHADSSKDLLRLRVLVVLRHALAERLLVLWAAQIGAAAEDTMSEAQQRAHAKAHRR